MTKVQTAAVKLTLAAAITAATVAVASIAPVSAAEPKVTYVGDGKFLCSGNSAACAQVDANNRQREVQRQNDYQRDQDRADRYIQDNRRRENEQRNDSRRY